MPTLLETYETERDGLLASISQTLDGVEGRDLSDVENRTLTDARARVEALNGQIELVRGASDLTSRLGRSERREQERQNVETRSLGEQFADSDVLRNYSGGTSGRLTVESRALPIGTDVAGNLYRTPNRVDITEPITPTPLLDLLPAITVGQRVVETVQYTKVAGGADVVAEKAAKPSVEYDLEVVAHTLPTIAGYTQMTRQMMEDYPAVRDAINAMLRRDVVLKMETEAAAALVAATLPTATSTTLLKAIRTGIGTVQAAGFQPTSVLLNPADWADLDIDIFDGSVASGAAIQQRFWGLRPISSAAQPAGTATVGDFASGVQHYRRSGVSLYVTDSHANTFIENVFTVLAETSALALVSRPAALVECSVA